MIKVCEFKWDHSGHKYVFYEVELLNMYVISGKLAFYGPFGPLCSLERDEHKIKIFLHVNVTFFADSLSHHIFITDRLC